VATTHVETNRRSALVPSCYRWRLVIGRPCHRLSYLFGCEKHGHLRADRSVDIMRESDRGGFAWRFETAFDLGQVRGLYPTRVGDLA
jgi:hypothetical protein